MRIKPAQVDLITRKLLNKAQSDFLFCVLGNTPAALNAYLKFNDALSQGRFDVKLRRQVALAVAESNLCNLCIETHTTQGSKAGLTDKDIADARQAMAADAKTNAILKLVRSIVVQRGELSNTDFDSARASALSDEEIVETIANVALNIFTNYVNHINHVRKE
jgi:AhpD family alkylhydroperoxidase